MTPEEFNIQNETIPLGASDDGERNSISPDPARRASIDSQHFQSMPASSIIKTAAINLPMLNGKNWAEWQHRMHDYLHYNGLTMALRDPDSLASEAEIHLFNQTHATAAFFIKSHIEFGVLSSIDEGIARLGHVFHLMAELRRLHASRNPAVIAHLWEMLRSERMASGSDLRTHLARLNTLRSRVVEAGEPVPPNTFIPILLRSLPHEWQFAVMVQQQSLFRFPDTTVT